MINKVVKIAGKEGAVLILDKIYKRTQHYGNHFYLVQKLNWDEKMFWWVMDEREGSVFTMDISLVSKLEKTQIVKGLTR